MDKLVEYIDSLTVPVEFDEFVSGARAYGARPELWLRAKHEGYLVTWIDRNTGAHMVARPGMKGIPKGDE
jgi:hypothetical protein